MVKPLEKSSEDPSATWMRSSTPSNVRPPPMRPVVHVGEFSKIPVLPLPLLSAALAPVPSSKPHAALGPVCARTIATKDKLIAKVAACRSLIYLY
jgi:hypothetical protein